MKLFAMALVIEANNFVGIVKFQSINKVCNHDLGFFFFLLNSINEICNGNAVLNTKDILMCGHFFLLSINYYKDLKIKKDFNAYK